MRSRILAAVLIAGTFVAAWFGGRASGLATGAARCSQEQANRYAQALEKSAAQLRESQALSRDLFTRLTFRAEQGEKTTQELRNALAETAASRLGCRLPADVMQQLDAARDRAAQAATGGLGATLPGAGGDDGQQP